MHTAGGYTSKEGEPKASSRSQKTWLEPNALCNQRVTEVGNNSLGRSAISLLCGTTTLHVLALLTHWWPQFTPPRPKVKIVEIIKDVKRIAVIIICILAAKSDTIKIVYCLTAQNN